MIGARIIAILLVATIARHAEASPNLALDHPVYEELARLQALGRLAPYDGGFAPLTALRAERLLRMAGADDSPLTNDVQSVWLAPIDRFSVEGMLVDDNVRPYSTPSKPRPITGGTALSCERNEGNPCGRGIGTHVDVDAAGGYGRWVSAVLGVRATVGSHDIDSGLSVDRAYVLADFGLINFEVGRDTFALGPTARTQLSWGRHAAPADHLRLSTAHPWELAPAIRVNGHYVLARMRAPQRYPGTLASTLRGQVDIAETVEVGVLQMLQLGGDGARELSPLEFVLEHVRRGDISAGETDSSNRRFGGDVSARILSLAGVRLYYVVVFEDIRRARWIDAIRYDADHLIGIDLAAIGPGRRHGATLEWHKTGIRSQEHGARTTGFTNAGRVVGSPLGPDSQSLFLGARIRRQQLTFYPWIELTHSRSDTYQLLEYGPINRTMRGVDEGRYRFGVRARVSLQDKLWLDGAAFAEYVDDFAFESDERRIHAGASAMIVWYPDRLLGTLGSD